MKNEDVFKWANRYGLDKFPSELRAMIDDAYKLVKQEDDIYTSPKAAVPDAIHHTDLSEGLEYIQGWNDCRAEMLKGLK
jgi:hypothetical protein